MAEKNEEKYNKFLYWFFDLFPGIILKQKLVAHFLNVIGNGLNDKHNEINNKTNYDV